MKFIVTGSLGHIGKLLTQELLEKGHSVTVISSKDEKKKEIEAFKATAAIGSIEDVDFLTSAFTGADAAFAMIPPNFEETDQVAYYTRIGNNYAQAIIKSGIKHVVHLSSYGADLDKGTGIILGSHNVENIMNKLTNVSIIHLRAMYFYYNLYHFSDMIKRTGIIGSNYGGDDRLVMVDPKDIAAAAAEEMEKIRTGKQVRYVASDERSASEVARIIGNAIGKPDLKWLVFPGEQTLNALKQNGIPTHIAEMLVELNAAIHSGIMLKEYDEQKPEKMGDVRIEDFAREFALAFNSK